MWLGTEIDKVRYFHLRLAEYRVASHQLPHLSFGSGGNTTLRMFPDKLPVGVDPTGNRHVFTCLVTRPAPADFRAFLVRHHTLLDMLSAWRLRILVPEKSEKAIPVYRHGASALAGVNDDARREDRICLDRLRTAAASRRAHARGDEAQDHFR